MKTKPEKGGSPEWRGIKTHFDRFLECGKPKPGKAEGVSPEWHGIKQVFGSENGA